MQAGFSEDGGTWLAVGAAATQLNMACVNALALPLKVGGWTSVGREERVTVTLLFSGAKSAVRGLG